MTVTGKKFDGWAVVWRNLNNGWRGMGAVAAPKLYEMATDLRFPEHGLCGR